MVDKRKKKKEQPAKPAPAVARPARPQRALTAAERKQLRGFAHALRPLVQLGRDGLSPGTLREIERGLASHELIKIRLVGERETRARLADEIALATNSSIAGAIGMVVILYRQNPDPDERRVELGSDLYR
jgi:putative YhbY family RNA-binding protein